jgi:hypothetical protein
MPFLEKLAVFWVGVYVILYVLACFPKSRISHLAFSWHGPAPRPGERKDHFMFRLAGYALSWFAQVVFLFALGYLITWWRPSFGDETWFLALWAFALPIFGGMALLGAFMAVVSALKARLFGPNPTVVLVHGERQA